MNYWELNGINYWKLKNPDPGMAVWAKYRLELIFPKIQSMVQESCKGAFQSRYDNDSLDASDQRIDFMKNVYLLISNWAGSKIDDLDVEIERRRNRKQIQ